MVAAMAREIDRFPGPILDQYERNAGTLYFGGGTPSLLSRDELQQLMEAVHQKFELEPDAEITLEANPDDITPEKTSQWKAAGINRLSIGVQSFIDEHLQWMNRAHRNAQTLAAIKLAQDAGITNISIDLIYGIPGLTDEQWQQNLTTAFDLGITHLSAYALTVEPHTALDHFIRKGKSVAPDEGVQANQFDHLQVEVANKGWEAYEIANYALPGFRSRHNSSYWQGLSYYGFGPSAHSFDGHLKRWWNVANNALYQSALEQSLPMHEAEILSPLQRLNEQIMTSLRTMEGLPVDPEKKSVAGVVLLPGKWEKFENQLRHWQSLQRLVVHTHAVQLSSEGKYYADGISASLFVE
jgi:oxygen-independent coproporphyrinogen-3 oxidase